MALAALTMLLAAIAISSAVLVICHQQATMPGQLLRPSGIPASIPTSLVNLMSLTPVPAVRAPGFTLTDQHGRTVTLPGLRGKAVVLAFMDSHCVNICPIVSEEFIDAYHRLWPLAGKVVFAAVNVNPYHAGRDRAGLPPDGPVTACETRPSGRHPGPRLQPPQRRHACRAGGQPQRPAPVGRLRDSGRRLDRVGTAALLTGPRQPADHLPALLPAHALGATATGRVAGAYAARMPPAGPGPEPGTLSGAFHEMAATQAPQPPIDAQNEA
jgi:hypothetical protein